MSSQEAPLNLQRRMAPAEHPEQLGNRKGEGVVLDSGERKGGPGLALAAAEAPGSSKPPSDLLGLEPGTGKYLLNSDSLKCTYQGNQDPRVAK